MVHAHRPEQGSDPRGAFDAGAVDAFVARSESGALAHDRRCNAVVLSGSGAHSGTELAWEEMLRAIWHLPPAESSIDDRALT